MTRHEFDRWSEFYFTAFPDSARWLNALPHPQATLETWLITLSKCTAADVMLVTQRIIAGELAPIENYQRDNTALHIRAYASRVADERRKRESTQERSRHVATQRHKNRQQPGPSTAGMYLAILQFRAEGEALGFAGRNLVQFAHDKLEQWLEERESVKNQ